MPSGREFFIMQNTPDSTRTQQERTDYIKLKLLVGGGLPDADDVLDRLSVPYEVVAHLKERVRSSYGRQSPLTERAQAFLDRTLGRAILLPGLGQTFILDRVGMAQELSLPEHGDYFESDIVKSYRLIGGQGVLHNPKNDRRTTQGVFHVAVGGGAIPDDKVAVQTETYARLLEAALNPPRALLTLPFAPVETFVSLMLRPIVVPKVAGVTPEKTMEIKFLAPGNLISNLDFIERIFGNAGDPHLPENDAALDTEHWTGHTGFIILAPHLPQLKKKALGLPHWDEATERQRRDGQCWRTEDEPYNGGNSFKITARDEQGVMVTIIADNYYGYCKKEVKTQINFAANLSGGVEEEHAGGAMAHPRYDLGKVFRVDTHLPKTEHTFEQAKRLFGDHMEVQKEGYGIDRRQHNLFYVPETVEINLNTQSVSWRNLSGRHTLPIDPMVTYIVPSGFKIHLGKETDSGQWRLIGTTAEGTLIHKPSTVSGGGKSEISKPVSDSIMYGPFFIADFHKDMDTAAELLNHDYGYRFRDGKYREARPILSLERSLGSVIKLLTPSSMLYSDDYNTWLGTIPHSIRELVYVVKRFYQPEMGEDWRAHFGVDVVNGRPGNALKFDGERLIAHSMRVGFTEDGNWRTFSLRNDFVPAEKRQAEDDITATMTVPVRALSDLNPRYNAGTSVKFVENVERCFFQRPDDAIHRGYDKFTETHFALPGNFFSNYQPLTSEDARALLDSPVSMAAWTQPMQDVVRRAAAAGNGYFVSSAHPRIVDGKPTKNPRYLQRRPDLVDARPNYAGEVGMRLHRKLAWDRPLHTPVNAVLPGRRLNPPDVGVRSLAVYNPIHFQETPELFMELISSLTGKSPSTTGAGSEGALTKGPFNAWLPIVDLNNALVSHILNGTEAFITAAGYVGPKFRMDHDISLLVPEVWARMEVHERSAAYLIENKFLEQLEDFDHAGQNVPASRLGWRITPHFVRTFFGIVFDNPNDLFTEEMLRPELQGMESFVDGIENIVSAQKSVAENYFHDGGIEIACPPLQALLHIMRDGKVEGKSVQDPEIRALFTPEALLGSEWYEKRLQAQQAQDERAWTKRVAALEVRLRGDSSQPELLSRLRHAQTLRDAARSADYLSTLHGFLGADPSVLPCP
jgi:hypothetical protein